MDLAHEIGLETASNDFLAVVVNALRRGQVERRNYENRKLGMFSPAEPQPAALGQTG